MLRDSEPTRETPPPASVKGDIAEKVIEKTIDKAADKVVEKLEKATKDKDATAVAAAICGHEYHFKVVAKKEVNEWFWWNVTPDELTSVDSSHQSEAETGADQAFKDKIAELTSPECGGDCPSKRIEIRNRQVVQRRRIDTSGAWWTVVYWECAITAYLVWKCE